MPKPNSLNNPQYVVDFDVVYIDYSVSTCDTSTFHTHTHAHTHTSKFFKIADITMLILLSIKYHTIITTRKRARVYSKEI